MTIFESEKENTEELAEYLDAGVIFSLEDGGSLNIKTNDLRRAFNLETFEVFKLSPSDVVYKVYRMYSMTVEAEKAEKTESGLDISCFGCPSNIVDYLTGELMDRNYIVLKINDGFMIVPGK